MTTVTKNSDSKWSLINFTDVWGNPVDGWEVNDLETMYEDLYINSASTDQEILHYLKTTGYLSTGDILPGLKSEASWEATESGNCAINDKCTASSVLQCLLQWTMSRPY